MDLGEKVIRHASRYRRIPQVSQMEDIPLLETDRAREQTNKNQVGFH